MSKPSPLSRSSSSESLVESSSHETPAVDEQSKSPSPPVMQTKTKKSAQREAYKASANVSSSWTITDNIGRRFKTEIDTAQELNAKKQHWEKFSKNIIPDGVLILDEDDGEEIHNLAEWLNTNPKAKLNKLDLAYCYISADRAKALADILKTNKKNHYT